MDSEAQDSKVALRRAIRSVLKAMGPAARADASAQVRARLQRHKLWKVARSILFYAPTSVEVDVWPLLEEALAARKIVALPRFMPETGTYVACPVRDLAAEVGVGHFGIREPLAGCAAASLKRLDLLLVPGVAFDSRGRRLGRGKGYYDRLLATMPGSTVGVAFDEQIVCEVPVQPHDMHLNWIVTPTRWFGS